MQLAQQNYRRALGVAAGYGYPRFIAEKPYRKGRRLSEQSRLIDRNVTASHDNVKDDLCKGTGRLLVFILFLFLTPQCDARCDNYCSWVVNIESLGTDSIYWRTNRRWIHLLRRIPNFISKLTVLRETFYATWIKGETYHYLYSFQLFKLRSGTCFCTYLRVHSFFLIHPP